MRTASVSPSVSRHLHYREGEKGQRVDFNETIADNSPILRTIQVRKAQGNSNRFGEKGFFPRHVTNSNLSKKGSGVSGEGSSTNC